MSYATSEPRLDPPEDVRFDAFVTDADGFMWHVDFVNDECTSIELAQPHFSDDWKWTYRYVAPDWLDDAKREQVEELARQSINDIEAAIECDQRDEEQYA